MEYCYIHNGDIKYRGKLPTSYKLVDGTTICNLKAYDSEELVKMGWFPIEIKKPEIDPYTQKYGDPLTTYLSKKVLITYPAVNKSPEELAEDLQQAKLSKISAVEQEKERVIFNTYRVMKQVNLNAQQAYARDAIRQLEAIYEDYGAGGKRITEDEIVDRATSIVGMIDTIPELTDLEIKIKLKMIDISHFSTIAVPEVKAAILNYYYHIIESIIVHRKIRHVHNWGDSIEAQILGAKSVKWLDELPIKCDIDLSRGDMT